MHIRISSFRLKNVTEEQYDKFCDQLAPAFAKVPGALGWAILVSVVLSCAG